MTWHRKPRSKILAPGEWRQYLTEDEARVILDTDVRLGRLKAERNQLAAIRGPIQNRAIQRAKYALGLTAYHRRKKG
jgi:hypothetical protein